MVEMEMEKRSAIGLSWAPKIPSIASSSSSSSSTLATLNNKKNINSSSSSDTTTNSNKGKEKVSVWISDKELVDGLFVPPRDPRKLNKLIVKKKNLKDTNGPSWFDMPAPTITPELKKDLDILKMRDAIDPKRHFKKGGKSKAPPKYFQVGTVIEPISEFYSSRLTKKERKATFADELLSDQSLKAYRKRKVQEIENKRHPGGVEKWKIKGRQTWKSKKQMRE